MASKTCYMCGSPASSIEHVPPRSLFPDEKRQNLITVPSCELHNNSKSDQDEYLMVVLSSLISGSDEAHRKVWPKVMRSFQQRPNKSSALTNLRPVYLGGIETAIFDSDVQRYDASISAIIHGLYFAMFEMRWKGQVEVITRGRGFVDLNNPDYNRFAIQAESGFQVLLGSTERYGNNPDIFYFRYFGDEQGGLICLTFYKGINILALLGETDSLSNLPARLASRVGLDQFDESDPRLPSLIQHRLLEKFPVGRRIHKPKKRTNLSP